MTDIFDLSDSVALVTGAGGVLGGRFARVIAGHGGRVAATARSLEKLAGIAEDSGGSTGTIRGFHLDVTDRESIAAAFDEIEAVWGRVNLLINNAGITHSDPAAHIAPETWRNVLDVDLNAPFFVMQEFARRLIAAEVPGTIVNIASILGIRADKGVGAYAAAKAGLIQLTRTTSLEWARYGIRVNAIAPGWFPTAINQDYLTSDAGVALRKRIPMRRFGEEHDLDGALLLLASKAGAYMTGTTIVVDGGLEV